MLRLEPKLMLSLFVPTCNSIKDHIASIVQLADIHYLFLVGGFAESQVLQKAIRDEFNKRVRDIVTGSSSLIIIEGV